MAQILRHAASPLMTRLASCKTATMEHIENICKTLVRRFAALQPSLTAHKGHVGNRPIFVAQPQKSDARQLPFIQLPILCGRNDRSCEQGEPLSRPPTRRGNPVGALTLRGRCVGSPPEGLWPDYMLDCKGKRFLTLPDRDS